MERERAGDGLYRGLENVNRIKNVRKLKVS